MANTYTGVVQNMASQSALGVGIGNYGPWTGYTILNNGILLELGGHSDAVCDGIEGAIVRSGAKTKEDVLRILGEIAAQVETVKPMAQ
ncbi:hypothetical protein HY285_03265 [Candidatus Peregrinibacteria bacterium]|nr:hypothetical protein [Candidatus Peregrinibacteria bacterium]MBI3816536.1 hypothetical protein [Candidatus Peregrinibacteria bacterium]